MTALVNFVHRLRKVSEAGKYLFSVHRDLARAGSSPVVNPLLGKIDSRWCDVGDLHCLETGVLALGAKKREARQPLAEHVDRE